MKNQIILFFFLALMLRLPAQQIGLSLDKTNILIGEQIRMDLQASFTSEQVSWFTLDSFPHFEILERSKVDTARAGTNTILKQTLTLTSWDSGHWQIPAISLGAARTKPVSVMVSFSKMDPNQPYHDVKDILSVKKATRSEWYWYLLFVVALLLLFLLFFPGAKEKEKQEGFIPDEGAYKAALRQLEQLRAQPSSDQKQVHTQLVNIFREYLEKRKNIRSFSKTTDDLAVQVGALSLQRDAYASLVQTLRLSDLVKFAQFQPAPAETAASIDIVEENIKAIENIPHAV